MSYEELLKTCLERSIQSYDEKNLEYEIIFKDAIFRTEFKRVYEAYKSFPSKKIYIYSIAFDHFYRTNIIGKKEELFKILSLIKQYDSTYDIIDFLKNIKNMQVSTIQKTIYPNKHHKIDIKDFLIRYKLSREKPIKLEPTIASKITKSRFKFRNTIILEDSKDVFIQLDMSYVKYSINDFHLLDGISYEIELEFRFTDKQKLIQKLIEHIVKIKQLIHDPILPTSIITETEKEKILKEYFHLFKSKPRKKLIVRKPISIQMIHFVEKLKHYAVTDKADGERYNLICFHGNLYAVNNNLKFYKLDIPHKVPDKTVFDCERIQRKDTYIFLIFDCIFYQGKRIGNIPSFVERQKIINKALQSDLGVEYNYLFELQDSVQDRVDFYKKQVKDYIRVMKHLESHPVKVQFMKKLFLIPLGLEDNEIYKYASILLREQQNYPYLLDGLIFHPIEETYTTDLSKRRDLKWKPIHLNSIDFYVIFEKDEHGNIQKFFDNTVNERKIYVIAKLYVSQNKSYVPFMPKEDNHLTHIYIDDSGKIIDREGNMIHDKTVVEFYYNTVNRKDLHEKWKPIRTRYDKTMNSYGNFIKVAEDVWKSIKNPIHKEDFYQMCEDKNYIHELRKKISQKDIKIETMRYYAKQQKDVSVINTPLRKFHSFVKDILIYTYGSSNSRGKRIHVFDIGCGRGGDILKFYYANIRFYVGIDKFLTNLTNISDGAISRYRNISKKHASFPKMIFIHADITKPFKLRYQIVKENAMSKKNREYIKKYLENPSTYDLINIQFAIHYMLENDRTWKTFLDNLNLFLKPESIVLVTTFDADKLRTILTNKDTYSIIGQDESGNPVEIIHIQKAYQDVPLERVIGTGYMIKVRIDTISNEFIPEYLVDKTFLIEEFKNKCNLELYDTGMFEDIFNNTKDFFCKDIYKQEENKKNRRFYESVATFFQNNPQTKKLREYSFLYRYYVFKYQPIQKGGEIGKKFIKELAKHLHTSVKEVQSVIGEETVDLYNTQQLKQIARQFNVNIFINGVKKLRHYKVRSSFHFHF